MQQIAVVDDERAICELVSEALRENPAEVLCVHNGDDGRTLLQSRSFDLALIDVMMPGESGLVLAGVAAKRNTPALIMSGHPDAALMCDQFGFPFLAKPFRLDALSREAERVMSDGLAVVQRVNEAVAIMQVTMALLKAAQRDRGMPIGHSHSVAAWGF